jgi:glutaredoxin
MEDTLQFTTEGEKEIFDDVALYALSTCGFCKMSIYFLRTHKIKFRYIYIDQLDMDVKQNVKSGLKEKFNVNVGFPFLVINEKDVLVGYKEEEWKEKFQIK